MRLFLTFLCLVATLRAASPPVYVTLWFDTEDFVDPRSDDAAKEIAERLRALGVRGTFKVVGEKARALERNGRQDVIDALRFHDIGSHGNYHSLHPTPSEYLESMDLEEGAAQFYAHEASGVRELVRVFGQRPSCYGQPGNSFAPHTFQALARLGVPAYFDSFTHIQLDDQPYWFEGILTMTNNGPFLARAELDSAPGLPEARLAVDERYAKLIERGGGFLSVYYHPTEFVNAQFWDAANFMHGANPPRSEWRAPKPRTPKQIRRAYDILQEFVEYVKTKPAAQFITASEFYRIYADVSTSQGMRGEEVKQLASDFQTKIGFAKVRNFTLSAAEITGALVSWEVAGPQARTEGIPVKKVLAPHSRGKTTWTQPHLSRAHWLQALQWADEFIRENGRLPATVWFGLESLAIEDFAATLAGDIAAGFPDSPQVPLRKAVCGFCDYVAKDDREPFEWPIHPKGFRGPRIMELTRLLAWSLKPALPPRVQ